MEDFIQEAVRTAISFVKTLTKMGLIMFFASFFIFEMFGIGLYTFFFVSFSIFIYAVYKAIVTEI